MDVQESTDGVSTGRKLVSRRAVNIGAAWSVPVILTAVAAPTASASPGDPGARSAALGTAFAEKGEDVDGNRQVTFSLAFTNVVGTNTVCMTAVSGFDWAVLPTQEVTITPTSTLATFMLTRPDTDNSATTVDITYKLNGTDTVEHGVIIKNKAKG